MLILKWLKLQLHIWTHSSSHQLVMTQLIQFRKLLTTARSYSNQSLLLLSRKDFSISKCLAILITLLLTVLGTQHGGMKLHLTELLLQILFATAELHGLKKSARQPWEKEIGLTLVLQLQMQFMIQPTPSPTIYLIFGIHAKQVKVSPA